MNIVVTGANRGIGLEMVKQAVQRKDRVLAFARSLDGELSRLQAESATLDVTHPELEAKVKSALADWSHVDILVNNAGILRRQDLLKDFEESFRVNSIAPFMMFKACEAWLKKSAKPTLVNVSSLMGSVQDNGSGGYYSYRASKSALNMINKSLSIDHPWLTTVVVHPGWVQTDMGGTGATTATTESVRGLWAVTLNLKKSDSGKFFDFKGKELTW